MSRLRLGLVLLAADRTSSSPVRGRPGGRYRGSCRSGVPLGASAAVESGRDVTISGANLAGSVEWLAPIKIQVVAPRQARGKDAGKWSLEGSRSTLPTTAGRRLSSYG